MQNQLIPVNAGKIGNIETLTINARELHQFLQLRSQFSNWMQTRIRQYKFTQDADYSKINKIIKRGEKPITEYTLTLDMGKELAMVERNDKGREARRYFIECEKRLLAGRSTATAALPELTVPLTEHLAQADEMGELRDENAALNKEVLGLYRSKSPVCKEKIVYRDRVPVKVVELMLRYNIPRELVSEACGRDRGHLRVINCNARKAGRLS